MDTPVPTKTDRWLYASFKVLAVFSLLIVLNIRETPTSHMMCPRSEVAIPFLYDYSRSDVVFLGRITAINAKAPKDQQSEVDLIYSVALPMKGFRFIKDSKITVRYPLTYVYEWDLCCRTRPIPKLGILEYVKLRNNAPKNEFYKVWPDPCLGQTPLEWGYDEYKKNSRTVHIYFIGMLLGTFAYVALRILLSSKKKPPS